MNDMRTRKQTVLQLVLTSTKPFSVTTSWLFQAGRRSRPTLDHQGILLWLFEHGTMHSSNVLCLLKLDRVSFTHFNAHIVYVHSVARGRKNVISKWPIWRFLNAYKENIHIFPTTQRLELLTDYTDKKWSQMCKWNNLQSRALFHAPGFYFKVPNRFIDLFLLCSLKTTALQLEKIECSFLLILH